MIHFLLKDHPNDDLLGEIVLVRTHNDDLLPGMVMEVWSDKILDILVFDAHSNGRMFMVSKITKDIGSEHISFDAWTWMFRREKQKVLNEYA